MRKLINIIKFKTLLSKYIFLILSLIIITIVTISYTIIIGNKNLIVNMISNLTYEEKKTQISNLNKKIQLLSSNVNKNIANMFASYDFGSINNEINSFVNNENILYAIIQDASNSPMLFRFNSIHIESIKTRDISNKKNISSNPLSNLNIILKRLNETSDTLTENSNNALTNNKLKINDPIISPFEGGDSLTDKISLTAAHAGEPIELEYYDKINDLNVVEWVYPIVALEKLGIFRVGYTTKFVINKVKQTEKLRLNEMDSKLIKIKKDAIQFGLLFCFGGLIVSIILAYKISNPIKKIMTVMSDAAQGKLKVKLKINTNDELEKLSNLFSRMIQNLSNMVRKVLNNAAELSTFATDLNSLSDTNMNILKNIANNVSEINRGTQNNVEFVAESMKNIEKLAEAAQKISNDSKNALHKGIIMEKAANDGSIAVDEVIRTINEIKQEVDVSHEIIKELDEASRQINEIAETLQSITVKTNTLAYNVSISSIKAGEQAKEISVIGRQVRDLASSSSKATGNISGIVDDIQRKTILAVQAINSTMQKTDKGVTLAQNAGRLLKSIVESAHEVDNIVKEISELMLNQSKISNEISEMMGEVNDITKQSFKDTTLISDAVDKQLKSFEQLNTLAQQLNLRSKELEKLMDEFSI